MSNVWSSSQELILKLSVVVTNDLLLLFGERKEFTFFFLGHTLESYKSFLNFFLKHWKQDVTFVTHHSTSDTGKCRFKGSSLDLIRMFWVSDEAKHFVEGAFNDTLHFILEVGILEVLNLSQHSDSSLMERSFSVQLAVGKEVHKTSLLDVFVFFINVIILQLLFGVSEMLILSHLCAISPLVGHLHVLVVGVHIVEHRELWTNQSGKVSDLDVTNVKGDEELMMPDHCSEPVVVFPTTHSGDGGDGADIQEEEDEASS